MKLSTRTRYAMRFMIELALHYGSGATLLRTVAEEQQVSEKYLSQIVLALKKGGLIISTRGARGGHMLNKAPTEITAHDIFICTERSTAAVPCVDDSKACTRYDLCASRGVWECMQKAVENALKGVTLEEMANDERAKRKRVRKA